MLKISLLFFAIMLNSFTLKSYAGKTLSEKNLNTDVIETTFRNEVVLFAKNYLGTPYRYASVDPAKGFDCSGFVHYVYKNFDIDLPHSSKAFKSIGRELRPEEFKVGDVLVFNGYRNAAEIGHVGIICEANGMKSKFIHSSSGKVKGVIISELNSEMYSHRFYKCVNVIEVK